MKKKFSKYWKGSKQPRKQRKYSYNAPLHIRHKFLSANLSKELRKKHGKRSAPLRKGDEVVVMRGKYSKKKGKILTVSLYSRKVTIDGINRKKTDGTNVNVPIVPSNLQITSLNLEDKERIKKFQFGLKPEKHKAEKENASDKSKNK